jgi:hypothetical protein
MFEFLIKMRNFNAQAKAAETQKIFIIMSGEKTRILTGRLNKPDFPLHLCASESFALIDFEKVPLQSFAVIRREILC